MGASSLGVYRMKTFHASPSLALVRRYHELFPADQLNLLLSLAFNEAEREGFLVQFRDIVAAIVGDSGAWSVAMGKSTLTLEAVINFLLLWGGKFDRYFSFDTDFSNRGFVNNIANQLAMEKEGLVPIPVVHNFYNFEIDYYVRARKYDWLALGSRQSSNFRHIKHAVNRIKKGNPAIKIHWFGGSKYEWLIQLPIASCDTTSWAKTGAYGVIRYWNPQNEGLDKTDAIYVGGRVRVSDTSLHDFVTYPYKKDLEKHLQANFGFGYKDLCGYDDKVNMQLVNMKYYTDMEQRVNEERLERGIPLE
jgi:hypothetical protein